MANNRHSQRSERWEREDRAPRLAQEVPGLASLRLELVESSNGHKISDSAQIRYVVVASAAALFEYPCGDRRCDGGGHDVSREVLTGVRSSKRHFVGSDRCTGYVGDRPCGRLLQFEAHAEYVT